MFFVYRFFLLPIDGQFTRNISCVSCESPHFAQNAWALSSTPPPLPACYRSLSGPSGQKCPRSVPDSVPENGGCPRQCPTGCPGGLSGPGLRSVQKVSRECPRSVRDTFLTRRDTRDTFLDTPGVRGPTGPRASDTPHFRGHSGDTSGPKGPRDSCSRPAGSQGQNLYKKKGFFLRKLHETPRLTETGPWQERFLAPSVLALTEFRGESSVSSSQPIVCLTQVLVALGEFGAELSSLSLNSSLQTEFQTCS